MEIIKTIFNGNVEDYEPYITIINDKWDEQLGRPLHPAGFLLNPGIFYEDISHATNHKVWGGFLDAVETMYHNDEQKVNYITIEFDCYKKALEEFKRPTAVRNRDKMSHP